MISTSCEPCIMPDVYYNIVEGREVIHLSLDNACSPF